MNFTYYLSTALYSPSGIDSFYMRHFPDKFYEDYWYAIYYFAIMGGVLALVIFAVVVYNDFDKLTDFEKRRRVI